MKINNMLTFALTNLWRNKFLSLSTVLIVGLILFAFNVILSIHMIAQSALTDLQKKVDIILYLKDDADVIKVSSLIEDLKNIPTVEEVILTTKEEALSTLLSRYPLTVDPFKKYGIENPLPSHINLITGDSEKHAEILELASSPLYKSVLLTAPGATDNRKIVEQLLRFTASTRRVLVSTLLIFVVSSIIIISNAITLSIYHKREELNIMKLVGAAPNAIRGPFIMEGLFYGIAGFAVSAVALASFLEFTELDIISFKLGANILAYLLMEIAVCALLGSLSSTVSIQRYLMAKK